MKERQKRILTDNRYDDTRKYLKFVRHTRAALPVGVRISESGNSSKFDVSSMLLISMGMAAGLSLGNRSEMLEAG